MITGITLDWFLKLIDRFIALLTATQARKRRVISEVVLPTFERLRPVADDYFKLYSDVCAKLRSSATGTDPVGQLNDLVLFVHERRPALLAVRIEILSMARAIRRHTKDFRLQYFADLLESFFFGYTLRPGDEPPTQVTGILRILEKALSNAQLAVNAYPMGALNFVADALGNAEQLLEQEWSQLGGFIAELKLEQVGRPA